MSKTSARQNASRGSSVNLYEWQQQNGRKAPLTEAEEWVKPKPCLVCGRDDLKGAYGNRDIGWTCSKKCETVQEAKYRYPGHTAEAFIKLHNL